MRANFIPALLLGACVFVLFRWWYFRANSPFSRAVLIMLSLAMMVPSVLFASNYLLYIPYADWFYEFHAFPGAEVSSGLVGALSGIMFASDKLRPNKINGCILIIWSVVSFTLLLTPFMKQLYDSVDYSSLKDKWKDDICLQTSGYTCVPACAATLVRLHGGRITEAELARAAGTIRSGTEYLYMMRALRKRGYESTYNRLRSIKAAPVPSILGVHMGNLGHVVVLLHKDKNCIVIGEPLTGRREYTWRHFNDSYNPDKSYITIERIRRSSR
ncbi:MAG: cysteine peptidase family C39 domain-containing protein [Armatimonadota bacterium]